MLRTFLAFELPFEIRQSIILFKDSIKNYSAHKIKWVKDENLHITLQFIGDTKESDVSDLSEMLEKLYSSINQIKFEYKFQELVPDRNPRIIWLKLETDSKEIYRVSHRLRGLLFLKAILCQPVRFIKLLKNIN